MPISERYLNFLASLSSKKITNNDEISNFFVICGKSANFAAKKKTLHHISRMHF